MIAISQPRLEELFQSFFGKRIAVIGDLMLDRYLWGTVTRISPEAPVPVVEIERESTSLGGAANVVHNVVSLGAEAIPLGVIGDDQSGRILLEELRRLNLPTEGVIIDPSRPTTVKTRVIAHSQHVVRTDRESRAEIATEVQSRLLRFLREIIHEVDAVIIEDYNKGLMVKGLIDAILSSVHQSHKILTVDPKFNHFFDFIGCTVFKPNRKETEEVLGVKLTEDAKLTWAGAELLRRLRCDNVLITLGERGMVLFEKNGEVTHVPVKARTIHDVSGAGDTVIGTVTVALTAGASIKEAATLANYAAGLVCGEVGAVPIERDKLFSALSNQDSAFSGP